MEDIHISSSEQNGLQLHLCNTDKFKTISIMLMMKAPLQEELTTARALIPYILNGGSINYPNRKLIKQKLDGMYGATLSTDVLKKGDNHIIAFRMELPADQFLNVPNSLLKSSLDLLHEVVYSPLLENGVFNSAIVEQEKRLLKQRLASMYNEKMLYVNIRLIEEMFKGEPYQLPAFGREEDIASLNASSIYQVYEELLQNARFDLFIVGTLNENEVKLMVQDVFSEQHNTKPIKTISSDRKVANGVKVIQDKMDVKQGKLLLGYRTFSTIQDEDYEATRVANAIFGRFPSSKLFVNLREKESLAYFALSQIESNKGLLTTMTGIDFDNYERAIEIMRKQEYAMKEGDFTEAEVEQGKAMLINLFLEAYDTPLGIMDISIQAVDSGLSNKINNQIKRIRMVSKSDVIRAANKWELDTIYFLNRKG
ncbi:pitrilysin family protein (plasmid) [Bacillus mycoides]|uniref:EF-P 5-aminopentanol modification-associated protein YfmF n=1 Tax=Bacillus mycoides TaxID=1405 RepID=UPI0024ADBFE5|nr:pitrilysin family protein [Bacillus mycoides]MDI6535033.1 pitrilysin family protein [Bacillus mycoides]WJE61420.1 pitrilysin family protein [Bacillus mycoides]WJE67368.1 pitrilysin family protein [Bacillus mycoides]WJE73654.1 pitrilysin family protein [Bacillus mycoides]